jgi:ABC-2 type transport system ATP-binding protein
MPYTVNARGITKTFGDRVVLDHVDLAVEAGSVLALLGPNGAGKTTLVRILATLVHPDAGTATVAGHDLLTDPLGVKRSIGLTGQYVAIDEVLTGRENLEMMAELLHLPRRVARSRVTDLLGEFELLDAADRRTKTYSGGMRRRLDLAISLIETPQLLFLDEPTTGLDPASRDQLWVTVRRLVDGGITVLLTTQYLEEADQLADGIALLDRGRIVARGAPEELKAGLSGEVVRLEFDCPGADERARALLDVDTPLRAALRSGIVEVPTNGSAEEVRAMLCRLDAAGTPATKVSVHRPSLDDVFLTLTGRVPTRPQIDVPFEEVA